MSENPTPVEQLAARFEEMVATEEEVEQPTGEDQGDETSEEEVEETQTLDEEESGESETEDETEEEAEDESEAAGETAWSGLSEVLEAANVDPKTLPVTIRHNGQDLTVNLHEALQGYQRKADYDRRREELDQEKLQITERYQEQVTGVSDTLAQLQVASEVITKVAEEDEKAVHEAYGRVDWAGLREKDPAQYSALRADYNQDVANVAQRRDNILSNINGAVTKAQEQLLEIQQETKKEQYAMLLNRNPTWKDPEVMNREAGAVTTYLKTEYGATNKELKALVDHRILDMARKAMEYDKLVSKGGKVVNMAKKTGKKKLLRPGATKTQPRTIRRRSSAEADEAAKKVHESGKQRDAELALSARWRE